MKRIFWVILAVFLAIGATEAKKPHRSSHFSLFYTSLSSHGEWMDLSYGTVWRPHYTGHHWRPYMRGRWMWTDYGWYWNSYEPYGWATYHYGRWVYDDYYGWIWVPDDVWGPAWVEWRYDDAYIGWAPLPPSAQFSINVGITFGHVWTAPVHYWNFVECGNFSSPYVVDYVQAPDVSRRIYGHTRRGGNVRTVDRRIVNDGIEPSRVERHTREKVRKVEVVERNKPGEDRLLRKDNRDRLEVYRPTPDEVRTGGTTREKRRQDATARPAERNGQKSLDEIKRGRTSQGEPGRSRPQIEFKRPDKDRGAREISVERPAIKLRRPAKDESAREKPAVRRDTPETRSTKPDGKSAQRDARSAQQERAEKKRGRDR